MRWFVGGYIGVDGVSQGFLGVNRCFLGVYSILLKAFNTQWAQWVQSTDIVGCRVSILGTTKIRFREVSPLTEHGTPWDRVLLGSIGFMKCLPGFLCFFGLLFGDTPKP